MTDTRNGPTGRCSDALSYQERRFQSIFQHSAVSIWEEDISALRAAIQSLRARGVVDMSTYIEEHPEFLGNAARMITVVDVNEATLALYEVADRRELLGPLDRTLDLDDPATRAALRDDVLLIAEGGTRLSRESRATTPSGKKLDIFISLSVPAADDVYPNMLVNVLDITQQKRAEEELRESERHYRELFIAAQRQAKEMELLNQVRTALMHEVEVPEVIRTVVEGIAAAFGYTHVSMYLLKGDALELQHKVGYEVSIDKIPLSRGVSGRVARTGRPVLLEDVRADPDFIGAISGVHSELCLPLFDQGRVVGILNVETTGGVRLGEADLRLMTALGEHVSIAIVRARLYADVRQSEGRYRSLVEDLGEGIAIVDPAENFLFANPAADKVFGVERGSLTGQNLVRFLSPEEYQRARVETGRRRLGETSTFEQQIIRPDGTVRQIALTATPQYDQQGAFSHTLGIFRDVTESKNAERSLRESEERFRKLGEAALEGIAITERGIVVDGNGRLATMLGYELGEMIGKPVLDFIAPDSHVLVAERISSNDTGQYEHSLRRRDGSTFPVESHARMINWEGRLLRVTALHDVSERRQAQEQLRKLSLAVSQSPVSIVITDVKGNIEYVNPKFTQITGYSPEEALGKNPRVLKSGETSPEVHKRLWETITAGREWQGEFRNKKKNGELFWEMASISPVKNAAGVTTHFVAVKEDITDRKRVVEQLAVSEERYRRLFEDAPIGIAFLDTQREITLTNQCYRDFLGLSEPEIIERGPAGLLHPDDWEPSMALSVKLRSGEIPLFHMEQRYIRGDGTVVWADTHISALRDSDGRLVHTIGWVQDITGRKRAEEEKAKLQEQLTHAKKIESVGRLAGGVAHDFNNMLGVILGHADLALEQVDPSLPLHASLKEIRKAAERSADLTRQLLSFARRQTVTPRVLDLNKAIVGTLNMLKRLIGEDISLSWNSEEGLWPVRVDPSQIDQILANLCVNARDAISGVGRITIETTNSVVEETHRAFQTNFVPGEYVLLTVHDTGRGMDKETMSHIFEPFFTTKGVGKGTGLGLATVYGAVQQNNGIIFAESEPGQGTTFSIYLPRYIGRDVPALRQNLLEPVLRGQETILVVEDEPANLKLIVLGLKKRGYTVIAASTPGEAMHTAREYVGEIDLLVTDVVMPEMNGRELAKRLLSLFPHLKILFMSGYTADVIALHGVLEEGVNFIEKPFSLENMAGKVRETLEKAV